MGGPGSFFSAAISEIVDPSVLMQRVTDRTLELVRAADGAMVGLVQGDGVVYVCGAGQNVPFPGTRVEQDQSLTGLAIRTGRVLRSDDTTKDPRVDAEACKRLSVISLVCIPLFHKHTTLGVLAVNASRPNAFGDDDVEVLTRLADFVSVAVGSAHDLSRASGQLLELGQVRDGEADGEGTPAEEASRFVMGILSPDTALELDTRRRVQQVFDNPGSLAMAYQPIVDLRSDEVVAVEALSRIHLAPRRTPDVWFADAYRVGLGIDLELLATTTIADDLAKLPGGVSVTINLGPVAVAAPPILDALCSLPLQRVVLELTEHDDVDDYPGLTSSLHALRRAGVRIAVDDAGTGYSGLAHILKVAPDLIKLDRELVSGIDMDPVRRALAASLVAFAADTGAEITAEGVETADELEALRRLGVQYAQGYHLGAPAPLSELRADGHTAAAAAPAPATEVD